MFGELSSHQETGLNVFRRDLRNSTTVLVTQNRDLSGGGAYDSGVGSQRAESSLTPDGNMAIIASSADNLIYEDSNGFIDLLVWRAGASRDSQPRFFISREDSKVLLRWPSGASDFCAASRAQSEWIGSDKCSRQRHERVSGSIDGKRVFPVEEIPELIP